MLHAPSVAEFLRGLVGLRSLLTLYIGVSRYVYLHVHAICALGCPETAGTGQGTVFGRYTEGFQAAALQTKQLHSLRSTTAIIACHSVAGEPR